MLKKELTLDSRTTYKYDHNLAIFVRNKERMERKPFQKEYESNYATNEKHINSNRKTSTKRTATVNKNPTDKFVTTRSS